MDIAPSGLREVYWRLSFEDLRTKLRISTAFQQVRFAQEFQILAEIVSAAFGKQENGGKPSGVMEPKNSTEAAAMLRTVLGR